VTIDLNKSIASAHPMPASTIPPRYPSVALSRDDGLSAGSATASTRVMIVEDDFLVAIDMESALTDAGIAVVGVASSAEDALLLAEAERPALAVMDIRLAGKRDGIDAALDLFGGLGIRCIFATAHHDERTRARAQAAQPLAWVPKPYAMASLVEAVQRALLEISSNRT
jgi:DNA-binding NarL/FixJ family response regulator